MELRFACLYDDVVRPTRKHYNDAGVDLYLYAPDNEFVELYLGDIYIAKTGVTVEIPQGYFGWITNKSKNNFLIGGGIVDEGYQGELLVKITNQTNDVVHIRHGQAIAQLLIIPCVTPFLHEVLPTEIHKEESARGVTGGIVYQSKILPGAKYNNAYAVTGHYENDVFVVDSRVAIDFNQEFDPSYAYSGGGDFKLADD